MGGNNWRREFQSMVNIYGSSCFHFTIVSESGFLNPGHNRYRQLISIMPFLALSPVPNFLLWSPFSYYNSTSLLSSDSDFSTKIAPKLRKQFRSMTPKSQTCLQVVKKFDNLIMCWSQNNHNNVGNNSIIFVSLVISRVLGLFSPKKLYWCDAVGL